MKRCLFIPLVCLILTAACGGGASSAGLGTEAGNPETLVLGPDGTPPAEGGVGSVPPSTEAESLMFAVCGRIVDDCFLGGALTRDACRTAFRQKTDLEAVVGPMPGAYANYGEIIIAETNGEIRADHSKAFDCRTAVMHLDCSVVSQALDANNPTGLGDVASLLDDPSCHSIFSSASP